MKKVASLYDKDKSCCCLTLGCKPSFLMAAKGLKYITQVYCNLRVGDHEASQRLGNHRTTLGKHLVTTHPEAVTGKKNTRDFKNFLKNYDFRILDRGRDCIDTFLKENLAIQREQPALNECKTNGWMF